MLVAKNEKGAFSLLPGLANRHGLITGATGTGKTVTMQALAEGFSRIGVPCVLADVKGDLAGLARPGAMSPKLAQRLAELKLAEPVFASHRFDLFTTFSMINERTLGGVLTICFDKDDPAETVRAQACYDAAFAALMGAGYVPYRVAPRSMPALDNGHDSYWRTVARIKSALDPQRLIAPGRYDAR
jgi:hypothetical protein